MYPDVIPRSALLAFLVSVSLAQGEVYLFQDGFTRLPDGSTYEGTVDSHFRGLYPTTSFAEHPTLIADDFEAGFPAQAAIRFERLLAGDGGLVDLIDGATVAYAELAVWVVEPAPNGPVEFSRVATVDATTGEPWRDDDTWASLGGDQIIDCGDCFGSFLAIGGGSAPGEVAPTPDFVVDSDSVFGAGTDSETLLSSALDRGIDPDRALADSFYRFDATEAVRSWLIDAEPNLGWVIDSQGGSWGFFSSDLAFDPRGLWLPESLGGDRNAPAPFGTAGLPAPAWTLRPALTIVTQTIAGPADLDSDGDADLDDYDLMTQRLGVELEGPVLAGDVGDLDFDRDVDLEDFRLFKAAYEASALAIPEPTACQLLLMVLARFALLVRGGDRD